MKRTWGAQAQRGSEKRRERGGGGGREKESRDRRCLLKHPKAYGGAWTCRTKAGGSWGRPWASPHLGTPCNGAGQARSLLAFRLSSHHGGESGQAYLVSAAPGCAVLSCSPQSYCGVPRTAGLYMVLYCGGAQPGFGDLGRARALHASALPALPGSPAGSWDSLPSEILTE